MESNPVEHRNPQGGGRQRHLGQGAWRHLPGRCDYGLSRQHRHRRRPLVAGPEEAFHHCRAFLQCLGGDLRHLGPNVRAAATLDLALLSRLVGMVFGMIHGAHVCEAEGISLEQFAALLPAGDRAQTLVQVIHDDAFEVGGIAASVDVAAGATARLQGQAREAGINSEFPDLAMGVLKRAIAAGYGGQDTAAVIKVLRGNSNT